MYPEGKEEKVTNIGKTALVTGANSGLGFEAAAQLALGDFEHIILACRTLDKGREARAALVAKTGRDPFSVIAIDVSDNAHVRRAVEELGQRGGSIDFLLLNAGLVAGSEIRHSVDDVEITVAASLVGHHVLTTGLLNRGLLTEDAHIVIAGSEAARADVPGMPVTDIVEYAQRHHGGDRSGAIVDIARARGAYTYKNMSHYANAKVFVAWWAAALARRLPHGMVVNAVSPGSAPATNAMRNQSPAMKAVLTLLMRGLGPLIGAAAPVPKAARRYLDAMAFGPEDSGKFFASRPGKMIGALVEQEQVHILDRASQEALWSALADLSGGAQLTTLALRQAG